MDHADVDGILSEGSDRAETSYGEVSPTKGVKLTSTSGDDDAVGGGDHLSSLPDDVLLAVLLSLPNSSAAARTSLLSRRWRSLWEHALFTFADDDHDPARGRAASRHPARLPSPPPPRSRHVVGRRSRRQVHLPPPR
uniref:F-box domain-containing protein n=1 Tax=Oryza brachyantha TaxID=4533 RepID=J3MCZ3_ORYBR